ncbi:Peptidase caspase domain protein [Rutstroemia sp. NJR-2017a WRK4]|nr:Peptidase caspase domain protein [Rutstroemia sp. NJR-2017a WRK4]
MWTDEVLLPYIEIRAQKRPKWYQHRSLFNWTQNQKPLVRTAEEFIYHSQDFILLRQREGENWIKETLDAEMYRNPTSIFKSLLKNSKNNGIETISYYDDDYRSLVANILWGTIIAGILLAAICLLFLVSMSRVLMAMVIFVFDVLVFVILTVVAKATLQEAFLGTAAYVLSTRYSAIEANHGHRVIDSAESSPPLWERLTVVGTKDR